jgi:hypothetical protein
MALWQLKLHLVPSVVVGTRLSLTAEERREQDWQDALRLPDEYQARLATILPAAQSWHDQLLHWGSQDGDLIEVWLDGARVESLDARVDCRSFDGRFIRELVNLAREWKLRLVCARDGSVLREEFDTVIRAVVESPNRKWLEAPDEWLPKLATEAPEPEDGCHHADEAAGTKAE